MVQDDREPRVFFRIHRMATGGGNLVSAPLHRLRSRHVWRFGRIEVIPFGHTKARDFRSSPFRYSTAPYCINKARSTDSRSRRCDKIARRMNGYKALCVFATGLGSWAFVKAKFLKTVLLQHVT